jgi:hypothetical protein
MTLLPFRGVNQPANLGLKQANAAR